MSMEVRCHWDILLVAVEHVSLSRFLGLATEHFLRGSSFLKIVLRDLYEDYVCRSTI